MLPASPVPARPQLPAIRDTTPGNNTIFFPVHVVEETPTSLLVELPEKPNGRVRVSASICRLSTTMLSEAVRDNDGRDIRTLNMPYWLYKRVKNEF